MGYRLQWETAPGTGEGKRTATLVSFPSSCTLSHVLAEAAQVLNRETVRLHSLSVFQLCPNQVVRDTLLRYERDGLA